MNRLIRSNLQIFLAGLLAVLPLVLTISIIVWVASLVRLYLGPDSIFGGMLSLLGGFVGNDILAYIIGIGIVVGGVYLMGWSVQLGLQTQLKIVTDYVLRRIPLIGSIYDMTDRFVGIFDQQKQADMKGMSPVWCTFGGEGGTKVLALLPTSETVEMDGRTYHVVLVPTAPVPFGGALLYVPADWVHPAGFGVEQLTSIYVSMGVTTPAFGPSAGALARGGASALPAGAIPVMPQGEEESTAKPKPQPVQTESKKTDDKPEKS